MNNQVDKSDIDFFNSIKCGPTHHFACECREAMFKELDRQYQAVLWQFVKEPVTFSDERIVELRKQLGVTKNEPRT